MVFPHMALQHPPAPPARRWGRGSGSDVSRHESLGELMEKTMFLWKSESLST